MTLSKELRAILRKKLENISERQLSRRIHQTATISGIPNLDTAALFMAHQLGITIEKPMYGVDASDLKRFEDFLARQAGAGQVVQRQILTIGESRNVRAATTRPMRRVRKFLSFGDRYPALFYKRLEQEINSAVAYGDIPSAAFVLSRKMVENLLYNLLQLRYGGPQITKYFDIKHRRPLDFSVLIDNLGSSTTDFEMDQHGRIEKFLNLVRPFRENANSKAHDLLDYAESMAEVQRAKVPEMVELMLLLIEAVKQTQGEAGRL